MKIRTRNAGLISIVLGLAVMLLTYVLFAKVDLVYMKDGVEICRQGNVCAISEIVDPNLTLPDGVVAGGETLSFTYTDGENAVDFDHSSFDFRLFIAKTVAHNLRDFKWSADSHVIIMTVK